MHRLVSLFITVSSLKKGALPLCFQHLGQFLAHISYAVNAVQ